MTQRVPHAGELWRFQRLPGRPPVLVTEVRAASVMVAQRAGTGTAYPMSFAHFVSAYQFDRVLSDEERAALAQDVSA